jgi:hypothetical protein
MYCEIFLLSSTYTCSKRNVKIEKRTGFLKRESLNEIQHAH